MAFGLQFLDGVGDAYNQPVYRTGDYENRPMNLSDGEGEYGEYGNDASCGCGTNRTGDAVIWKAIILLGVGMVAGQAIKKLFKD